MYIKYYFEIVLDYLRGSMNNFSNSIIREVKDYKIVFKFVLKTLTFQALSRNWLYNNQKYPKPLGNEFKNSPKNKEILMFW